MWPKSMAPSNGTQQWHLAMAPTMALQIHKSRNPAIAPAMALRQSRRVSRRDTALSQQHYNVSRNVLIKEVSQRSNKGSFSTV